MLDRSFEPKYVRKNWDWVTLVPLFKVTIKGSRVVEHQHMTDWMYCSSDLGHYSVLVEKA